MCAHFVEISRTQETSFTNPMKFTYEDHTRSLYKVSSMDRWPLYRGTYVYGCSGIKIVGNSAMVTSDRWSLYRGMYVHGCN